MFETVFLVVSCYVSISSCNRGLIFCFWIMFWLFHLMPKVFILADKSLRRQKVSLMNKELNSKMTLNP